ncbi:MAG: putative bifunctional diguanylate cyclase/phosphodiesterase [Candidatus Limnocylindria bacterium]
MRERMPLRATPTALSPLTGRAEVFAAYDAVACGIIVRDRTGVVIYANETARRMFGLRLDEVIGRRALFAGRRINEDGTPLDAVLSLEALREGPVRDVTVGIRLPDGRTRWVLVSAIPVGGTRARPAQVVTSFIDITARKDAEDALRDEEQRLRLLAENSTDLIARLKPDGTYVYASPASFALLGYEPEELVGRSIYDFFHPGDLAELTRSHAAILDLPATHTTTYRIKRKYGDYVWFETTSRTVRDHESGRILEIQTASRDITKRKMAEEALEHQALHDVLTDLPNRMLLRDRLRQSLLVAQRTKAGVALLLIDLDRFKDVNDTFGHTSGDALLQEVAARFRAALRVTDTVARLGGDEFAVLMPAIADVDEVRLVADRLLESLRKPFDIEGEAIYIEASAGIVLAPDHGQDVNTLLRRADVAMYAAKRSGSGVCLYDAEQDRHTAASLSLSSELRLALERDELLLHFQPIVDLRTRVCVGVEALARWQHPRRGLVPPGEFIPVAEETGLIKPLGLWTLREALRRHAEWNELLPGAAVSVNLSMRNLRSPELPEDISGLLAEFEVPGERLKIELTESAVMGDPERTLEILERLHAMGVRFAIDDFGTGYSSFLLLRRLPMDDLKIDRQFVGDIATNPNSEAIVRSTIDLSHSLGLKAVAEGIEEAAVLEHLARLGCDLGQGYFIGRPMTLERLVSWLAAEQPA